MAKTTINPTLTLSFTLILLACQIPCCGSSTPTDDTTTRGEPTAADLVLKNGKIATVDAHFSIRQAVAVKGDRIVYVGDAAGLAPYVTPQTEVIDLNGKLVLPGLIDAHAHIYGLGKELVDLDISDAPKFEMVVEQVAERAASTPTKSMSGFTPCWASRKSRSSRPTTWSIFQSPAHRKLRQPPPGGRL